MSSKKDILSYLQASFEEIYALETQLDVRDFLVQPEVRDSIPGHVKGLPEQFFVSENDDGMELALFIDVGRVILNPWFGKIELPPRGQLRDYILASQRIIQERYEETPAPTRV